jgi:dihydroorotate dehydrogenase
VIYRRLRPLLFRLDAEAAHALALGLLRAAGRFPPVGWAVRAACAPRGGRPVEAFGLRFPNAVGLAAGYDKDGAAWRGLACLGFGHVEIGTVTPRAQPGNPRPRLFRLVAERALINRLGFPSAGADVVAARLPAGRAGALRLGINLGKQRETPLDRADEDYVELFDRLAGLADYVAINLSSPNTPELRRLQERRWLEPLLARLTERRAALALATGRRVPLLVKISPDLSADELETALAAMLGGGVDGVIATNTTLVREGLVSPLAREAGGLSGAPLAERATRLVATIVRRTEGRLPVVACGGVMGLDDARARLDAGACLVQLYTGLVYEGPGLVRRIVEGLAGGGGVRPRGGV